MGYHDTPQPVPKVESIDLMMFGIGYQFWVLGITFGTILYQNTFFGIGYHFWCMLEVAFVQIKQFGKFWDTLLLTSHSIKRGLVIKHP